MTKNQKKVLRKIIYAVETGGQTYGCQNYNDFTEAYSNSSIEHAITIGAGQWYGPEAKTLLTKIHKSDIDLWERLDRANIWGDIIRSDWDRYNVTEYSAKGQTIIKLISTNVGIRCQDALMDEQMEKYVLEAESLGVTDPAGQAMCANFRHQGGPAAVERILAKTVKPYTLDNLYRACQSDTGNQVGAYKSRQKFVYKTLKEYFPEGVESTMTVIEKAVRIMEEWARDNSHGYDQVYRWGEKGDYDCSAAVIQALENAGAPVKSCGATYTGNMKSVFLRCGFEDVTNSVDISAGAGLKRGDVLLNESRHVAMYCGNGKEVEASINEKGTATGGKPGDQTGREFLIRPYRNYPWDCVLRYKDNAESDSGQSNNTESSQTNDYIRKNTVNYVARVTRDTKCYLGAGIDSGQSKLFPLLKKDSVVDVMQFSQKDDKGKKWLFIRIPHPTEGFVFEFIPGGCLTHLK